MGLPSKGIEHARRRLSQLRDRRVPVFVDVVGTTPDEIIANVETIAPLADALTVSLECPNTRDTDANKSLSAAAAIAARAVQPGKPTFVKVPLFVRSQPDQALQPFLDLCVQSGVAGVIVSGARHVTTRRLAVGHGQLGGRPTLSTTLDLVRRTHEYAGESLAIIATGGIFSGRDAFDVLSAGASLIQIYSAVIYRGWSAPARIADELANLLDEAGIASVRGLAPSRSTASPS